MKIQLVVPALPPRLDGIGDYSARIAEALVDAGVDVTVLAPRGEAADPIPGVSIVPAFDLPDIRISWCDEVPAVVADRPDWVVLQYNPFSYGRRGFNLHLPRAMAAVRRRSPGTRVAIMFHETYVPVINWKFAVMTTWQRYQFWRLGRAADVLFFSIHKWAEDHRRWFPGKPIFHLPVGSNVPRVEITRGDARGRLAIGDDEVVLGVFGSAHASRLFGMVQAAAQAVRAGGRRARVLYVGPDGATVRAALGNDPTAITDGPLPAEEVSRRLSAVDLALSTYVDGVSTRRGAMVAALQHGLTVVGTDGINTDPELRAANGTAMLLTPPRDDAAFAKAAAQLAENGQERRRLAAGGLAMFRSRYAWSAIAQEMLARLGESR